MRCNVTHTHKFTPADPTRPRHKLQIYSTPADRTVRSRQTSGGRLGASTRSRRARIATNANRSMAMHAMLHMCACAHVHELEHAPTCAKQQDCNAAHIFTVTGPTPSSAHLALRTYVSRHTCEFQFRESHGSRHRPHTRSSAGSTNIANQS